MTKKTQTGWFKGENISGAFCAHCRTSMKRGQYGTVSHFKQGNRPIDAYFHDRCLLDMLDMLNKAKAHATPIIEEQFSTLKTEVEEFMCPENWPS